MTDSCGRAAVSHRFPSSGFALDLALDLAPGWNVLFGPSGAGKSTFLRAVAGLLRPASGLVRIGERTWFDSDRSIFVPAERRSIGFLAQRPVLFPHLSVAENVGFGLRLPARESARRVAEMMEIFHCSELSHRSPAKLSGGEQQRVALARAAVRRPQVLLLDEPFHGLDFELRDAILTDLQGWLAVSGVPVLAVSHDVVEICAVRAHVVRIAAGKFVESGPASAMLAKERQQIVRHLGA